jgi:hypothetical protein
LLKREAEFSKAHAATFGNRLGHVSLCDFGSFVLFRKVLAWHFINRAKLSRTFPGALLAQLDVLPAACERKLVLPPEGVLINW